MFEQALEQSLRLLDALTADDPDLRERMEQCARTSGAWVFAHRFAADVLDTSRASGHGLMQEDAYRCATNIWLHLRLKTPALGAYGT